ncbi:MAG TPA: hypothetical protein VF163_18140 [Micromonosporaceae bacterium]
MSFFRRAADTTVADDDRIRTELRVTSTLALIDAQLAGTSDRRFRDVLLDIRLRLTGVRL